MASTHSRALVLGAVLVTVLSWASAFVVIRDVGREFGPGELALGRLAIGSVALGLVLAARRDWRRPTGRVWWLVIGCGVLWFGVYNVALNAAERLVDAGTAAMLVNSGPVLVLLLAGFFLGEGFPRWLVIGSGVALAGAVLIGLASRSTGGEGSGSGVVGVVLCLVAAVSYAVSVVLQKPALRELSALQVTFLACAIGMVACLPFAPGLVRQVADAPAADVLGLVYLGLVPTALAFATWAYALTALSAGRLGVSTYLVPPITVLLSWAVLGEVPPWLALAGGALCLVGVALTRRTSGRAAVDPAADGAPEPVAVPPELDAGLEADPA